jgi:shikimate dehydrogenase
MVIGYPLEHTQSPILHNTMYHLLNCNAVMLAHHCNDLVSAIQAIKTLSVGLVAVTMPFKEDILPLLDDISAEAKKIKSVNTVIGQQGKLMGYNTDVDGIAFALRHVMLAHKTVLIIGAGGASRAAAHYLNQCGAHILWLNRTARHVVPLIELFGGKLVNAEQLDDLPMDAIINTTPLGMLPNVDVSPLPHYQFNRSQIIFDMVYNPRETRLIKDAKSQGAQCISGLAMFIGQGLKQIELWLNKSIVTPAMVDVVKAKLDQAQGTA